MLLLRPNSQSHRPWCVFVVLATVAAAAWYVIASQASGRWVGGGSLPGLVFGIAGGLLILFEFALWGKKKLRTLRIGRAQTWMIAHIWLGLLTVPLILLHSGFRLGGPLGGGGVLSTLLFWLFAAVIASGIWGLAMQQYLPRAMYDKLSAETIHSQIDHLLKQYQNEGNLLVIATCGPDAESQQLGLDDADSLGFVTVGAVRTAGKVQGKVLQTRVPKAPVPGAEGLRDVWKTQIEPFLTTAHPETHALSSAARASVMFDDLRTKLDPAAHDTVRALEDFCDQRRQFEAQRWMHFWLHSWLVIHTPLSTALVVLMLVHVFTALRYL